MHKIVSIYPVKNVEEHLNKWDEYLSLASKYDFDQVFTTLHLPEASLIEQVSSLEGIVQMADKYHMETIVDMGGNYIRQILTSEEILKRVQACHIDYVRLDCNYSFEQVKDLYEQLDLKGFVINASLYNRQQLQLHMEFFATLKNCQIKACHNFYPREESGLDEEFAIAQDEIYREYINDICYCVPSLIHPRGPVFKGLPTIESQRYQDITLNTLELVHKYKADSILLADEYFNENQMKNLSDVLNKKPLPIRCELYDDTVMKIVVKQHEIRYDSNNQFLRSQSSRSMAEKGTVVKPNNCVERKKGDITVDNELYGRYSSEVQIVLKDAKADKRVNVVGRVHPLDFQKLAYYRYGYSFILEKIDK